MFDPTKIKKVPFDMEMTTTRDYVFICSKTSRDGQCINRIIDVNPPDPKEFTGDDRMKYVVTAYDILRESIDITEQAYDSKPYIVIIREHEIRVDTYTECFYVWIDNGSNDTEYTKPEVIVCAANMLRNGEIVLGIRHHDSFMNKAIKTCSVDRIGMKQGFITNKGNFLERKEALELAIKTDQRKFRCGGDDIRLYSENLY